MRPVNARSSRVSRFLRAGPLVMVLGALLVVAGVVQSTSSNLSCGDNSCPAGTALIAKFNYSNGYVFEKPAGNSHVVTLSNASSTGATWHSTQLIADVLVKGGPSTVLIKISPPQYSGSFTNAGLPKVGNGKNLPAISNVQFCGPGVPPTTTTTKPPSTTTTKPPSTTTTTNPPSTTTTKPPSTTTTTNPPSTTTTTPTTVATTTTSIAVSPTTITTVTTTPAGATTTTELAAPTSTSSGSHPSTSERVQGSTTTNGAVVTSTSVLTPQGGGNLPFTGGNSMPLVVAGIVLLASGFMLTLSDRRRRQRSQA